MTKEHQISKLSPFIPPFHPFRGWFRKNPFLADTNIVIGTYTPNFTFLAPVVSALRWSSVSQSVSLLSSTNWQPVLRYGKTVFTKESKGTEIFVVVALLCKFWSTSKLYIYICPRRRLHRMCALKSKTPCRMRGIRSNIHQGGEGWLGFPDLWSGQKRWWNWFLTPVANFGEFRRA